VSRCQLPRIRSWMVLLPFLIAHPTPERDSVLSQLDRLCQPEAHDGLRRNVDVPVTGECRA